MTCDQCGLESDIHEAFRSVGRSFRLRPIRLCPECLQRRQRRGRLTGLILTGLIGLAGLTLAVVWPEFGPGWLLLNYFVFQTMLMAAIIPHELGHAVAARLLGMRVFQVAIGSGRLVWERRWRGTLYQLRAVPYGGVTYSLTDHPSWYRLRRLLVVSAGPLANFLLVAAAWPWADNPHRAQPWTSLWIVPPLFLANAVVTLANLIPYRTQGAFGVIDSDGLQLCKIPFLRRDKIVQITTSAYCTVEGLYARQQCDHVAALRWFKRALTHKPEDWALLSNVAISQMDLGDIEPARETFQHLLARESAHPARVALMRNNLAYADALAALGGRTELLPEADELSEAALASAPWVPAFKGTRGAVLVAQGLYDAGMILLREAMQGHTEAIGKAANAYMLALAEDRRGHEHERDEYLALARKLDPGSNLQAFFPVDEPPLISRREGSSSRKNGLPENVLP